jgi:RNA polymerase sigma-70 factor (ECF subfamily)
VYLFTAVRNTSINYLVKSRHYTTWDIDQVAPEHFAGPLTPEELAIGRELKQLFATAIAKLPPKCQMVYKLVREDRFTYREVADIMDISENTVDRHLNIAMHRLSETLQAHRKNSL